MMNHNLSSMLSEMPIGGMTPSISAPTTHYFIFSFVSRTVRNHSDVLVVATGKSNNIIDRAWRKPFPNVESHVCKRVHGIY